ncbi:hypothetical protein MKO06_12570 [Gramella sp. GC03-9]|uniref:Outer membrane protein beta-barrel domain-containing protein n=1 Tax=Christiangramia oceanisediminis TaxID=2920386 RepID=A0A9X2KYL4_9FLAO|nr:hypothetical protein [Gramella oceanisediminis]MCP9200747.1 hypothetical protein [Gramella oceanisediminis]
MKVLLFLVFILLSFTGYSQDIQGNSLQKYEPENSAKNQQFQNGSESRENRSIFNRRNYSLESLLPGLFFRPEQFSLDSPFINAYGTGFNLKYYPFSSNLYIFTGMQYVRYDTPETARVTNFGLNAGLGYDLNENTQIEGRLFHSLYNSINTEAFQPVQFTPVQPLSLGFKTKF